MLLVVDANVVFSAIMKGGRPLEVFESNKIFSKFEFVAPEFLFFEVAKRADKIVKYTRFSEQEFARVLSFVKAQIEPIPFETFEDRAKEALEIAPHLKDVPYVALSFKFNCKILSGDKKLKQSIPDRVIAPSEALDILYGAKAA
jgi:predicted nucleic acid-binding protein